MVPSAALNHIVNAADGWKRVPGGGGGRRSKAHGRISSTCISSCSESQWQG